MNKTNTAQPTRDCSQVKGDLACSVEPKDAVVAPFADDRSSFLAAPLSYMADDEVRRLKRVDLLEIMVAQGDEIARLRAELDELRAAKGAQEKELHDINTARLAELGKLSEVVALVQSFSERQAEQSRMLRDIQEALQHHTCERTTEEGQYVETSVKSTPGGLARRLFSAAVRAN